MPKDYKAITETIRRDARTLKDAMPDVMHPFAQMSHAAYSDGVIGAKVKELVALAIGIALRCEGCIAYHAQGAARRGATREEVLEIIGVAVQMGGGPASVYAGDALAAFDAMSK